MAYTPPYEITDRILNLTSTISEKLGRVAAGHNLEAMPHLRRNNRIRSVHSSLRIEANSLSLGQVRDVINGKIVLGPAKEIQEVKNAYDAYGQLRTLDPYSMADLKRVHGIMTRYLLDESGTFRTGEEGVFSGNQCIFMAPPARLVPSLMENLFAWMQRSREKVHPLVLSAVFHYEFVFIHPFTDGNGRMARLWHTALLARWNPVFEFLPIESQIERFQDGYYQTIADCHKAGGSTAFIEFMLTRIEELLDELAKQGTFEAKSKTEYEKRLLAAMEPDVPYTANALLALLGLKSKETLRKHYLGPALADGSVVMTFPDKPKSKNQRYLKT